MQPSEGCIRGLHDPAHAESPLEFLFLLFTLSRAWSCRFDGPPRVCGNVCRGMLQAEPYCCILEYPVYRLVAVCNLSERVCCIEAPFREA